MGSTREAQTYKGGRECSCSRGVFDWFLYMTERFACLLKLIVIKVAEFLLTAALFKVIEVIAPATAISFIATSPRVLLLLFTEPDIPTSRRITSRRVYGATGLDGRSVVRGSWQSLFRQSLAGGSSQ